MRYYNQYCSGKLLVPNPRRETSSNAIIDLTSLCYRGHMSKVEPPVKCTYTRLETGIHHLTFLESSNPAMDQCLAHMNGIYAAHPPAERLMFLFDLRPAGLPPLRHMLRSAKQFYAQRPVLPETRAAYALLNRWEPDLFVDLHTTNGSYHGYALTWAPGLNPNSSPANDYARDRFLPALRERMRQRHRLETFPYGNFRSQDQDSLAQGWETYDPRVRFGTNAMGVRGLIPILSEGYSNNPFGERIRATYFFLREILRLSADDRAALKRVVAASSRWRPDSIALRSTLASPTVQAVIAEITESDGDGSHGFSRRRRTGVFRTIRMPVFDRFLASRKVARPAGYLIPPQHAHLAALLSAQGVRVSRLSAGWAGAVEAFRVESLTVAPFVFEGHRTVTVSGQWGVRQAAAGAGWYYVTTDQRLGVFAACLLEPASEDGYVTWNYLDRDLEPGRDAPVLRVAAAPNAPMVLVD